MFRCSWAYTWCFCFKCIVLHVKIVAVFIGCLHTKYLMPNSVTAFQDLTSSGVIGALAQNFSLPSHCCNTQFESTKVKWFLVAWYCYPKLDKKFSLFPNIKGNTLTLNNAVHYKARKVAQLNSLGSVIPPHSVFNLLGIWFWVVCWLRDWLGL
jgi:hypothetical protein